MLYAWRPFSIREMDEHGHAIEEFTDHVTYPLGFQTISLTRGALHSLSTNSLFAQVSELL